MTIFFGKIKTLAALAAGAALATLAFRPQASAETAPAHNQLTPAETAQGWRLLWNGVDASGWRGIKTGAFPTKGWQIKDGELSVLKNGRGGDIITEKTYSDFELTAEFKLTAGANSGIKYFAQTNLDKNSGIGLEFQILDDLKHPDAKMGKNGNRTIGSLYDLIAAPKDKPAGTVGVWHSARIVSKGGHVEHWLDGVKVVEFNRRSASFRALVAKSKYKTFAGFGEWPEGHILLQDHNDHVSFRNIKIREL